MRFILQPLDQFLGFQYQRLSSARVLILLQLKPIHFNSVGVVHGGIISTMVDVAMSNLVEADENGVQRAVTTDLHTTFVTGATGEMLAAEASIVKQGRRLMYAECEVRNDQDQLVARSVGTFFMKQTE
ncbi:PaaI family thioesterase [Alicyclobacillus ferrooxydans]|uniref:Thioesterase domain-containing protein n=1 Tax=Alicyclobacillus ferrooxydans TaxID=471514 RepID=A0A0P9CCZ7_9BACL|nr:PaaI family thioesterase [Alicyclobacillus ferrooxydans]KPV43490.1 hypothetical protein AN477_11750 [Alicyclobacillus ferrooxydans]